MNRAGATALTTLAVVATGAGFMGMAPSPAVAESPVTTTAVATVDPPSASSAERAASIPQNRNP